jgi:RNA polymerase sigma-70 factor (ECF subfamily)
MGRNLLPFDARAGGGFPRYVDERRSRHRVTAAPRTAAWQSALSDEEVVARVCAGDAASYEILMRRHNERLYRVVRAILRDEGEVEDVMQEAYLSAYRNLAGFSGRARFSTWLTRIAINQAIDRLRRAGRFVPFDPTCEYAPSHGINRNDLARGGDPEQQLGALEVARLLQSAIEALPAPYRAAYVLREIVGVETSDAAECLGVEEATVKTRVHRARRLLREALGSRFGPTVRDVFPFGGERCDRMVAAVLPAIG